MATTKKRINITPPEIISLTLEQLAKRDDMSVSSKATELIKHAIELEEDDILNTIAESRDNDSSVFVDHDKAWN